MSRFQRILLRRVLPVLAALFLLYILTGFFGAGPVVRSVMESRIAEATGREVTVERVALNPLRLRLRIEGFDLRDLGGEAFLGWDAFAVDLSWRSFFGRAWVVDDISFDRLRARVVIGEDGRPAFADLLEDRETEEDAEAADPPLVVVRSFSVRDSELAFEDYSLDEFFEFTFSPIDFTLVRLDTRTDDAAAYAFSATSPDGESVEWEGDFSLLPLASTGRLRIDGFALTRYAPYYSGLIPFEVIGGRVGVNFRYDLRFDEEPVRRLTEGAFSMRNLALREPGGETPFFFLPRLDLREIELDAVDFSAGASALDVDGLTATLRRDDDGRLRLERLWTEFAAAREAPADARRADTELPPLTARLDRLGVTNATFRLIDLSTEPTALVAARLEHLRIEDLTENPAREVPFEAALRMERGGNVDLRGTVVPVPFSAAAEIGTRDLRLSTFSPYAGLFADAAIAAGELDFDLDAELDTDGPNPVAAARGRAAVRGFEAVSVPGFETLVSFASLEIGPFTALYPEGSVEIEAVELREPGAQIVMHADGMTNLQRVLRAKPAAGEPDTIPGAEEMPPPEAPGVSPDFRVSVPHIAVRAGAVRFEDRSLETAFITTVDQLNMTVEGLSSDSLARADFAMDARIDRSATLEAQGEINPLAEDLFSDVTVRLDGFDLTTVTPYSGRYAGYGIDRGRLSLDLAYRVSAGSLEAENRVVLGNFYLGERIESPDATTLPVRLAVSIMRDSRGNIELNLPIRGNLNDPDFRIGGIIAQAVTNILVRAATSPFSLLGAAFGRGEELSYVDFSAGATSIPDEEAAKVEDLAAALLDRRSLELEVRPAADTVADTEALAESALQRRLAAVVRRAAHADVGDAESIPEDEAVRRLYAETFPEEEPPGVDDDADVSRMKERLLDDVAVDDGELLDLALERGRALRERLVAEGVDPERVFLASPCVREGGLRMNLSLQ
ncbi:MAG: DUF748 domain-containing protein [Opitutales bacterium]|nr:DUF748 domain-containing protein [Opitutales bacterium]